ncbi:hypothetical protein LSAT2_019900 [Lamellibrachia satsuma]|nr:hypothetical protein LSAT2_019900 [Lamellibrachia satsuma]
MLSYTVRRNPTRPRRRARCLTVSSSADIRSQIIGHRKCGHMRTRRAGALVRAFSGNAYAYPPDQRRRVHNQLQLSSRMPAS